MSMTKPKEAARTRVVIILLSAAFVLLLSETTSPLYGTPWGGDSAAFLTIGKYWARGVMPYVGLWDLKGPLIFAMDAAGYLIAGERWGVCLIQIALLYVSLTFAYKTFRIYEPSTKRCLGLVALYCASLSFTYTDNGTEELIFPLISASVYLFARWRRECDCQSGYSCHSWQHAVVYGATLAVAFLSRLTNALGVFAGAMAIAVVLVVHREWGNLFENVGGFLVGAVVPILPFWLYFQVHGAVGEWLYGSIFYNLGYMGSSRLGVGSLSGALRLFLGYGNAILLAAVGAWKLLATDRKAEGCSGC